MPIGQTTTQASQSTQSPTGLPSACAFLACRDRGEARGPHKKGESWEGRGDCIDCQACVVVCPMGIDIRDGSQLECINCGLCIDACDEIMDRVGRPHGLIAYDTDFAVAERAAKRPPKYRLVRARTIYYAVALVGVSGLVTWGLAHREPLDLHALRDRNPTFVRLHDGSVRNGYTLKIANRTFAAQPIEVSLTGVPGARLSTPGEAAGLAIRTTVPANEVRALRVFVTASPNAAPAPGRRGSRRRQARAETKTTFLTGEESPP